MRDNLFLCYHALSRDWDADLSATPAHFERQMRWLVSLGYRSVRFTEATRAAPRSGVVAITFDDAFRSVFTLALPIMDRLGLRGTVFVPTDHVDAGGPLRWPGVEHWLDGPHAHELDPMSWDELRALGREGWEIGSHTCSHPRLTQLDDDTLATELARSKDVCEARLGTSCNTLAYPYGDVNRRVVVAAGAAGYRSAAALPVRLRGSDPLCWPRIGIYHADDERRFRMKTSPAIARVRRSPAWTLLTAPRRRARPPADGPIHQPHRSA